MTSKNSFWVNARENHKRRIGIWIVSMLTELAFYPGIMLVYLTRIRTMYENGHYTTEVPFKAALYDAAADGLGFKEQTPWVVIILAAIIGIQGFSYLYSRKKVDLYHSVPVPAKSRFSVVYINGIIIYLASYLVSIILAAGLAGINGALDGRALIECGLAFGLNILYFLLVYNAVILAMMLAGNIFVAGGIAVFILGIDFAVEGIFGDMKESFFNTASYMFDNIEIKFCALYDYFDRIIYWKRESRLSELISGILPYYLKWALFAALLGVLAYLFYKKRPSEAAGNAIAFPLIKPLLKVTVAIMGGLVICDTLYYRIFPSYVSKLSAGNVILLCMGTGLAALLCGMCMEAIYEFDIHAVLKHLVSTCVAAIAAVAVFCLYYFDVFGYDSRIPQNVESAAVHFFSEQSYFEVDESDGSTSYINTIDYLKENMFLTDIDALNGLIEKSIENNGDIDSMKDGRYIYVLFRLESGRETSRKYIVDYADPSNRELLDRIIGTKEYREGVYQIFKSEDLVKNNYWQLTYSNGTMTTELKIDASKLREAWIKDMENFDFSLARDNRQCGYLDFNMSNTGRTWRLPVYENFANTKACLEAEGVYVPAKVRIEDVASITVINWNHDKQGDVQSWDSYAAGSEAASAYVSQNEYQVRETYDKPEDIERIVNAIYPENLCYYWKWESSELYDDNYDVYITYKPDTEYKYVPYEYGYKFLSGQVPDFVEEMTSYKP